MSENESELPLLHICESCGVEKVLTPDAAYLEGWDYPPRMGVFTILSPRTCGSCGIDQTLWWRLTVDKIDRSKLSAADLALIERVNNEPDSIRVPEKVPDE